MPGRMKFQAQLVLGESETAVLFLYEDRELEVPRQKLLEFDEDGGFSLSEDDARALGLLED